MTSLFQRMGSRLFGDVDAVATRLDALDARASSAIESFGRVEGRVTELESEAHKLDALTAEARLRLALLEQRAVSSEAGVEETRAKNDRLGGKLLRLEGWLEDESARIARLDSRLESVQARLQPSESRELALEGRLAPIEARSQSHEGRLSSLADTLLAAGERASSLGVRLASLESRTTGLDLPRAQGALAEIEDRLAQLEQAGLDLRRENALLRERIERLSRIAAVMSLVEREPERDTLVSVILPTRDRTELLARAIASVRAQRHRSWELLVVDDGSRDGIREIVERAADPRVRLFRSDGVGAAAARNRALDSARGDVVAYLDDDNVMAPLWLHGVAWAFQVHPERTLLFGAQVVQDESPEAGGGPLDRRLWIRFDAWDRGRLEQGNYIDLGAVAHRRRLPEARFDEGLVQIEDWDLLLRLTRDSVPLELPLLSGTYRSDAPGRVTQVLDSGPSYDLVRAKIEADRRR